MAGTNKALLCFCLLMLLQLAMSSSSAQEVGGVGDSKKKCFPLWDNYCVKAKRCVNKCKDLNVGKGVFTKGRCVFFTCACCREESPDEIAPS